MGGIGFTAPALLWGMAAALAVPLIHLLKRPKTVRLTFSTLRFFDESSVTARRSRKLRKLLLLITRMLCIALIALIFSGPYNRSDPLRLLHDPVHPVYVAIDPTPSMTYRDKNGSPAERAHSLLDSLAVLRPHPGSISVYATQSCSFTAVQLSDDGTAPPVELFDAAAFANACRETVHRTPDAVFIFMSDFQGAIASTLDSLLSGPLFEKALFISVSFTPHKPWNVYPTEIRTSTGAVPGIKVRLVNTAPRAVSGKLQVTINTLRMVPRSCTLAPEADTVLDIAVQSLAPAEGGSIRFDCGDPLPFDDTRYFVAEEDIPSSILIIGDPAATWPVAAAITANEPSGHRSVARCTYEQLSIKTLSAADVIIICSGDGARQSRELVGSIVRPEKQTVIDACDSTCCSGNEHWRSTKKPLSLTLADTVSDFWRGFPSLHAADVHIYGYRTGLTGMPLAYLSNGLPFITLQKVSENRLSITLASPADINSADNLCETAFFVPLLDRLIRHAERFRARTRPPWIAGHPEKNPYLGAHTAVPVLNAEGKQLLLLQYQPFFTIDNPGVYRVIPADAAPYPTVTIVDPAESRTVYHAPQTVGLPMHTVLTAEELSAHFSGRQGMPWRIIPWIVVGILLILELLLRERPASIPKQPVA